jgi:hypothetical protein
MRISPCLRLRLINVVKEVIKRLINLDVDINGDVNRFYFNRCNLHFMAGLNFMFCAGAQEEKGSDEKQCLFVKHHMTPVFAADGKMPGKRFVTELVAKDL